jgi:hypothetical protein
MKKNQLSWPFSSVIDRNRNRPFNFIQNKVGSRSCFATHDFCTTIGQWSGGRRWKGINKPKRGYCVTMGQTSFGKMKSFNFLYIWNQKCSIQYPVLHKYYIAWFSLVRLFFSLPSLAQLFTCAKFPKTCLSHGNTIAPFRLIYTFSATASRPLADRRAKIVRFSLSIVLLDKRNALEKSTVY